MKTVLEARQVSKIFGGLVAVNKVDLVVPEGSIASIIGLERQHCSIAFLDFTHLNLEMFCLMDEKSRVCLLIRWQLWGLPERIRIFACLKICLL